ncbi:hypothetical protein Pcinc_028197, partial [Petrolisthes cinctipes]
MLYGVPIVSLNIDNIERLCLAQISNTLLKVRQLARRLSSKVKRSVNMKMSMKMSMNVDMNMSITTYMREFSYNEIHNRRVALGITCVQCTPVQLEILRRAGAMPISSRRCGMITKREAERLCKSFLGDNSPPKLPENFAFDVMHECAWGCRGSFVPSRYNSSRAKCIKCFYCAMFFSPNKFVFHSHRLADSKYVQPDAANFNSWRRHIRLSGDPPMDVQHAWEDVKAMFNGGTRKRLMAANSQRRVFPQTSSSRHPKSPRLEAPLAKPPSFPPPAMKADIPYPPPYLAPLPPPYPAHHKEAHQSFVDYLWGSRGSLPPLGLPYPLAWPRRPLPSFPPLPISEPRTDPVPDTRPPDTDPPALRPAHLSAFTPVNRVSPPPAVSTGRDVGAPLPDSSRHSDDETVDIEATDDDSDQKSDTYKDDSYKNDLYKSDSYKADSYKSESYKSDSYKHDLYKSEGLRADTARLGGRHQGGHEGDHPRSEDQVPGEAEVEESSRPSRHEDRHHHHHQHQQQREDQHLPHPPARTTSPPITPATSSMEPPPRPSIE